MADVKMIATRESYGNTLKALAAEGHDDLVVLDADLAAATKTGVFRKAHPDRHFDCGIAEANMMGVAAGLPARPAGGRRPEQNGGRCRPGGLPRGRMARL